MYKYSWKISATQLFPRELQRRDPYEVINKIKTEILIEGPNEIISKQK